MLTCEAVLSECAFLLAAHDPGARRLFALVKDGVIRPAFTIDEHMDAVGRLMAKYASVPMALAEACLVRMSELHPAARVFTIDGDFRVYRRHGRQSIPLIFPRDQS